MGYRQIFAAVIGASILMSGITAAICQQRQHAAVNQRHDGVYALDIFTVLGGCDKVYHWTIVVLAGHISSPVNGFTQAVGEITADGVVSLSFQRSAQVAFVAGEVRDRTGSGTWSSPTLHCAGSWSAVREDGPALSTAALSR
jgi:hypothetical protein